MKPLDKIEQLLNIAGNINDLKSLNSNLPNQVIFFNNKGLTDTAKWYEERIFKNNKRIELAEYAYYLTLKQIVNEN